MRAVAKVGSMSLKTVTKYWSEFKEHVKQANDFWKNPPIEAPVLQISATPKEPEHKELLITNTERYRRGTQLLTLIERIEIEARLTFLVNTGYVGETEIVADDTVFVFKITDNVEFVGFGELMKVA